MAEEILRAEEHPDDVEPEVVEEDLSNTDPVEIADDELEGIDFDEVDAENVPVLEEGADG
jgi:hypothetical protein